MSVDPSFEAPELPYEPRDPKSYEPAVGLIGCGGITGTHLEAYSDAGYDVRALCDIDEAAAEEKREEFYPDADVYTDHEELLARSDIDVVDITTHPQHRPPLIEDAIRAGKHVLSQKPFVLDLDVGERLVELAAENDVQLAVNQNGRWAPHFSYLRHAIAEGHVGSVLDVDFSVHFDHDWIAETPFDDVEHVILYDFAIHWFDALSCFMGDRKPQRVYASEATSPTQQSSKPLLSQASIEYEGAQASMTFAGHTQFAQEDRTVVAGTEGTLVSTDAGGDGQTVTLETERGTASPDLDGEWFTDGFHGSMAALLRAIETGEEPPHSGRNNLASLELCFAAVASAERGEPVVPGDVRRFPGEQ
ncbi:Predicted dehydrogenase [Natronoarchaeum philippinense]|uniref:Predicted dehydrogenase n=1 Tax=Natronoarchaeum philippinense TaxID=558529 RepID=A0A285P6L5_NATPI|nr:Gfo/Idh/MocA family oxidoreductase [Natronoarchaeum philippinense]SNZ17088.1 Predicted dehydrogenase [Natronoarchaeum philippinense]